MSRQHYEESKQLHAAGHSFFGLLMAAMRNADTGNFETLRVAFPDVAAELQARYDAPGGALPTDQASPTIVAEVQA